MPKLQCIDSSAQDVLILLAEPVTYSDDQRQNLGEAYVEEQTSSRMRNTMSCAAAFGTASGVPVRKVGVVSISMKG